MTRRTSILLISAFLTLGLIVCHSLAGDDSQSALQKQVHKFSTNGTLDETMAKLSDAGSLKIVIDWKALDATGLDRKATVVYSTTNATVEQLIEMALARAAVREQPLAWYMEGEVVHVTTQAKVLYHHDLPVAQNTAARSAKDKTPAPARVIKFDNTSLADVLAYVRETSKVNLSVNWKSLEESGITKETQISIEARDLTHAQLLDMVLDQISGDKDKLTRAYWVAHNGVVTIATGNALNNETITKVVDVSDLLMPVPNMQGPVLDLSKSTPSSSGGAGGSGSGSSGGLLGQQSSNSAAAPEEDVPAARQKLRENLIQSVKNSIGDDMWKPDGKGSITLLGSKMVISQTLLGFKLMENAGRK